MPEAPAHVAPLQAALLDDPLAFLSAEHARQTVLLGHLERVARAPLARASRVLAVMLLGWLTVELPMHVADEEGSLYPRLLGLDTAGVLKRLQAQHLGNQAVVPAVTAGLRRVAEGQQPEAGFATAALAFAIGHRQHLALEEASVMPLARRVLAAETLAMLADEMARRRA